MRERREREKKKKAERERENKKRTHMVKLINGKDIFIRCKRYF